MAQSGNIGLNWNQVLGMCIGAAVIVSYFFVHALILRRRRVALKQRPPQQSKILRPAGHTLQLRIGELSDAFNFALAQSILAGTLLGMLGSGFYPLIAGWLLNRFTYAQISAEPNFYYIYSCLFLMLSVFAWMVAAIVKTIQHQREMRNHQFGLRGEQAVAEALSEVDVVSAGYISFHDVPGDGKWNIDHVVIGPGGLFVLETKTRPRRASNRKQPEQEVWFDGEILQYPWCYDRVAVKQARRNTEWVKKFILGFAPTGMAVEPIIVVPGWYVKSDGNWEVKVMNANYLAKHLSTFRQNRYTAAELAVLKRRFDERCRDLEF